MDFDKNEPSIIKTNKVVIPLYMIFWHIFKNGSKQRWPAHIMANLKSASFSHIVIDK